MSYIAQKDLKVFRATGRVTIPPLGVFMIGGHPKPDVPLELTAELVCDWRDGDLR